MFGNSGAETAGDVDADWFLVVGTAAVLVGVRDREMANLWMVRFLSYIRLREW